MDCFKITMLLLLTFAADGFAKPGTGVNGGWSSYGPFGSCTKVCGYGWKARHRTCTNPAPANGGQQCRGNSADYEPCNTHSCNGLKIDGGWSSWSVKPCSKSCGGGIQWRHRTCTNPKPANGGKDCPGLSSRGFSCNAHPCKGNCKIKYTNWRWHLRGSLKSLDDHKMDCGDGKLLTMFHLESYSVIIRYKYQCCSTGIASYCTNKQQYTKWEQAGDNKATHLSKIYSSCGGNSFMSAIGVEHSPDKSRFRYNYKCCMLASQYQQGQCSHTLTPFTDDGGGKVFFLQKQTVKCKNSYALTFLLLNSQPSRGKWRYKYHCCKFGA